MSPEQAMGKRGNELDGRSDLYSLGIVMYQMLTGQLPFKAETTLELLLAHMHQVPTPIRVLRPDLEIPEPVANVVMRCLEKKRELRPATGQALIEDLDRAESVGAGLAPPREPAATAVRVAPARASRALASVIPTPIPQPTPRVFPAAPTVPSPQPPRWQRWVAIAPGVLLLALGGLYLVGQLINAPNERPRAPEPVPQRAPAKPEAPQQHPRAPVDEGDLTLQVKAKEKAWVGVEADGKPTFQGVLKPAEVQTLKARGSFDVITGNAGGIVLTLNGRTLRPLGGRRATGRVHLTREDLRNAAP